MVALGEIPFQRYYGSADSTPLFLVLAAAYFERTGDHDFLRALMPHIDLALGWIDEYGDVDGDGFVEYARRSPNGLTNQGWKDSFDSVFHADGTLAEGPIALCEIQGYGRCLSAAGPYRSGGGAEDSGLRAPGTVRKGILVRRALDLCNRSGRQEGSLSGALVKSRPLPDERHRIAGAGAGGGGRTDGRQNVLRLGSAYHRQQRGPLQSDVLS